MFFVVVGNTESCNGSNEKKIKIDRCNGSNEKKNLILTVVMEVTRKNKY